MAETKNVLMVAFHFPPAAMSSGHLRTLGFARHLRAVGWNSVILSAVSTAFPQVDERNNLAIPSGCPVYRAFALDAKRHMGIAGRYPGFLAQPDRWASWWAMGVWRGLQIVRRQHIDAIWSTYPIMTAHCIARTISHISKIPWVADFRDPVSSSVEADSRWSVASQHRWEGRVIENASRVVLTAPGALRSYANRYPVAHADSRFAIIENGYEDATFPDPFIQPPGAEQPLVFVHSGLLYAEGRSPLAFFSAVSQLKMAGALGADDIRIILRASGSESAYERDVHALGIGDIVFLTPSISHSDAIMEQARADALLLFQGSRFNQQIPAKLYEYLRAGRPIFALVDTQGDTADLLHATGGAELAPIDDVELIAVRLLEFVHALREGRAPTAQPHAVASRSRENGAALLAKLLDQATGDNPPPHRYHSRSPVMCRSDTSRGQPSPLAGSSEPTKKATL